MICFHLFYLVQYLVQLFHQFTMSATHSLCSCLDLLFLAIISKTCSLIYQLTHCVQLRQLSGTSIADSASSSSSTFTSQDVDGKESTDESSTSVLREDEDREIERERERGKSDSDIIRDMKIELK